jgi:hypothetical protein
MQDTKVNMRIMPLHLFPRLGIGFLFRRGARRCLEALVRALIQALHHLFNFMSVPATNSVTVVDRVGRS